MNEGTKFGLRQPLASAHLSLRVAFLTRVHGSHQEFCFQGFLRNWSLIPEELAFKPGFTLKILESP